MIAKTCPICNNLLQPNDQLIAYYVTIMNWWAIMHLKPDTNAEVVYINQPSLTELPGCVIPGMSVYCYESRFDEPKRL